MNAQRSIENIPWIEHPTAVGVEIKPLITRKDHGAKVTCMLVRIPAGKDVPEHVHTDQDDTLFPLAGIVVVRVTVKRMCQYMRITAIPVIHWSGRIVGRKAK